MTSSISTILIIGGTSGIGESFARRFHAQGKRVIITGRRTTLLTSLSSELPGLETYEMDNSDLSSLAGHVATLISRYPDIDSVWINAGIQTAYDFKSNTPDIPDEKIVEEVNVNATAVTLLARHFLPHLLGRGKEANLIVTSSGLGFTPFPYGPVYSATKAYVHLFLVSLRMNLKHTNVNVIEIVPPYVATQLDAKHRSPVMKPMDLEEYVAQTAEVWENTPAREIREIGVGTAKKRVETWRNAMQRVWEGFGMSED